MTTPRMLPPLSTEQDQPPSLAHVREGTAEAGHNSLSPSQSERLRAGIRRIRSIQRQIDQLNREKSTVYDSLRGVDLDPALVRKVVYRLQLSAQEIKAIQERDEQLARLWLAVADLQDEPPTAEPAAEPATTDA